VKINRTALAAAASVVAVVVAGTAALAANFGVLSGSEEAVDATPRIVSSIGDDVFVDVPVQEVTDTTQASQTLAYQVEGVGVVTLTRSADTLAVASIDVDSQWDAAKVPTTDGVSIRFTSSSQVIAFTAAVVDGQVVVDVVDETPAPVTGTHDDDDHGSEAQGYDDDEGSYDDD
jgi:hypothetical protein